ncbi:hypothetical protein [Phycicoccus sonneratiae]|uniref:TrbL/VirB6 plasmid conjugal transfer protein n=1 Tax=Phycicoccus sonneratiae TaxID=2807628 RepID=A0ABS2CTZ0_9MICO|nr:hypothetical protein [Phycicoccus sonneraticus]MBM6402611.1 hypothetical protein [Phycicoccus sonneraticus]
MRADGWDDLINPFTYLGNAAGKVAADAWTAAMLALWNGGLWLLRLVLGLLDTFLTPDLRESGPMGEVYRTTFWVAATLVVALASVQCGVAAFRRDGRALARLLVGAGQFVMVWAGWISYALMLLYACSGLTKAVMRATMGVDAWTQWQPWGRLDVHDITDGTIATVLGVLGMIVIVAAIGHLLVMLTRAAALVILTATAPIAAAGLVSEVGQSWFWKCVRWTHAAALTPPLMALVIGVGTKVTTATVTGAGTSLSAAVGTAVPGVVLILVSCFAPLALFRLLAFVDPGTSSGAAMRSGYAAAGGLQGLVGGEAISGTGAASSSDSTGRAAGEGASEQATTARFAQGAGGFLGTVGGGLGTAASRALGGAGALAAAGATVGADLSNQMGVGHSSYVPDFTARGRHPQAQGAPEVRGDTPDQNPSPTSVPPEPYFPAVAPAGAGAATSGAGTAGGAAGAAAAVPVVPV